MTISPGGLRFYILGWGYWSFGSRVPDLLTWILILDYARYGRGVADICMHNEKVNTLIKFLSFVQQYWFISVCHYQLILSFFFLISKLHCNDSFSSYQIITGKNVGWYHLLYFIVTLSFLIYYFVEVK